MTNKNKFCTKCGAELDYDDLFCAECGAKVKSSNNHNSNPTKKTDNKSKNKFQEIFENKKAITLILIIISLLIVSYFAVNIALNNYKEVDSGYLANPIAGEKVQFQAVYLGTTSWNIPTVPEYDIVKVDDQYFILTGYNDELYGQEGHTVLLKGSFMGDEISTEPMSFGNIKGRWFVPQEIEILD